MKIVENSIRLNKQEGILARPDDTSSRSLAFRPLHHGYMASPRAAVMTELIV